MLCSSRQTCAFSRVHRANREGIIKLSRPQLKKCRDLISPSTTTAATAVAAAAAVTTTATTAATALVGLADADLATLEPGIVALESFLCLCGVAVCDSLLLVQRVDGGLSLLLGAEGDESESP